MNDPSVQAMLERSRHNNLSLFIISQDYYEILKRKLMEVAITYSKQTNSGMFKISIRIKQARIWPSTNLNY